MKSSNLVFIISLPRSGSTLLQALLSNVTNVETSSEPWILLPFLGFSKKDLFKSAIDIQLMNQGVSEFIAKTGGNENYQTELKDFFLSLYGKIAKDKDSIIIDKTPRYYNILDEIRAVFPDSKIIILKRHPLAVLNSIKNTWAPKTTDLKPFYGDLIYAPSVLKKFESKDENCLSVRYEDLVSDKEDTLISIYKFIGLNEEVTLNYSNNSKFKGTLGDQKGVLKYSEPHDNSINNWTALFKDRNWNSFAKGYMNYLGKDFLNEYGHYRYIESRKTKDFSLFYYFGRNKLQDSHIKKRKLMKYYLVKLFYPIINFKGLHTSK